MAGCCHTEIEHIQNIIASRNLLKAVDKGANERERGGAMW
ncbi:DNA-binding transcriptional activator OsmE [Ahrensia sp. R2A130]|nr:DNA-binding transcriptional activator OsmE [Ahrensia sp. R2A130]